MLPKKFINLGYKNTSAPRPATPETAVVMTARATSWVKFHANRSYRSSRVAAPTISTINAKIGTPSTKAANIR